MFCEVKHVPAWVPGAWWSKVVRDWRFAIHELFNIPFDRTRKEMVCVLGLTSKHVVRSLTCMKIEENGTAQPSFVASHLAALAADGAPTQDDIDDVRGAAGTIYAGMVRTSFDHLRFVDWFSPHQLGWKPSVVPSSQSLMFLRSTELSFSDVDDHSHVHLCDDTLP